MVKPIVAYSYTRLSTEKQLKGYGATRQTEAVEALARSKGWLLSSKTFSDLGVSAWQGSNRTKGALKEFIELARMGKVEPDSVLIVENIDRLSREQVNESVMLMLELINLGIAIFTLSDGKLFQKGSDTQFIDLMMWALTAQRAHEESETKSRRIRDAKARSKQKMRDGFIGSSKPPLWLTVSPDKSHFTIIEERALIIQDIFQMYADGMSLKPIAVELNERGLQHWGKTTYWTHTKVKNLLANKCVTGFLQPLKVVDGKSTPDGEPIEDYYPRIVSKELFAKCQTLKSSKATSAGRHSDDGYMANIFKGLLKCGVCGSGMALNTSKVRSKAKGASSSSVTVYSSLRCSQLRSSVCKAPNWHYGNTETFTFIALQNLDWETNDKHQAETKTKELNSRLSRLETEYSEVVELANNAVSVLIRQPENELLQSKVAELNESKKTLEADIAKTKGERDAADMERIVAQVDYFDVSIMLDKLLYSDDIKERYRVNALLNRKLKSITLYPLDEPDMFGVIDIHLASGEVASVRVGHKYKHYEIHYPHCPVDSLVSAESQTKNTSKI